MLRITLERKLVSSATLELVSLSIKKVVYSLKDQEIISSPAEGIKIIPDPSNKLLGRPKQNLAPITLPLTASHIKYLLTSDNGKHI